MDPHPTPQTTNPPADASVSSNKTRETPKPASGGGTDQSMQGAQEIPSADTPSKEDAQSSKSLDLQVLDELLKDQAFLELPDLNERDKDILLENHKGKHPEQQSEGSKDSEDEGQSSADNDSEDPNQITEKVRKTSWQNDSDSHSFETEHLEVFKTPMDLDSFFAIREAPSHQKDPRRDPKTYSQRFKTQHGASPFKKRAKHVTWSGY